MSAREMTAAEEWYKGLQEDYRAAADDAIIPAPANTATMRADA